MAVVIPAELSRALGGAKDPAAVVMAMFQRATAPLREIHNRVAKRANIDVIKIEDADPAKAGKQAATIKVASGSSDPARLAAQWASMIVVKGKAGLYVDEAKRYMLKQPIGASKSLDAEEAQPLDSESIALLSVGSQMREPDLRQVRSLDPITLTILIGVGVPILCALIPIVLPMIIEWGKGAFDMITGKETGGTAPPPPAESPATDPGAATVTVGGETYQADTTTLLIAGLGLIGLIWYLKRQG